VAGARRKVQGGAALAAEQWRTQADGTSGAERKLSGRLRCGLSSPRVVEEIQHLDAAVKSARAAATEFA